MSIRAQGVLSPRSYAHHYGPSKDADHYVYRCFDADDVLLYIGCTKDVKARISAHLRASKPTDNPASRWLAIFMTRHEVAGPYRGRDLGRAYEADAILAEAPLFNFQQTRHASWKTRGDVARYLVERGHIELAVQTCCLCWREVRRAGAYSEACFAHRAAQVAGLTNLRPAAEMTDDEWMDDAS